MELKPGTFCPLIKDECIQFKCAFWTHVRGTHPQSGKEMDEYDCAVRWLPVMVIETTQQTRQVGAAVESFRNQMIAGLRQMPMVLMTEPKSLPSNGDS